MLGLDRPEMCRRLVMGSAGGLGGRAALDAGVGAGVVETIWEGVREGGRRVRLGRSEG